MSLLTIVQNACRRVGLAVPSSVASSSDAIAVQMLGILNEVGNALVKRHDWSALTKEGTFTTVAAETQVAAVTTTFTDFDRYKPDTMFNRTTVKKVFGPLDNTEWQAQKAITVTPAYSYFRFRGGAILFLPTPAAGESVYFEYIAKNWCQSSGGTAQSAFAADTDTGILSEELLTLGLVTSWQQAKGLEYGESFRRFEMRLAQDSAQEGAKPTLDMGSRPWRLTEGNIPEGSWS